MWVIFLFYCRNELQLYSILDTNNILMSINNVYNEY